MDRFIPLTTPEGLPCYVDADRVTAVMGWRGEDGPHTIIELDDRRDLYVGESVEYVVDRVCESRTPRTLTHHQNPVSLTPKEPIAGVPSVAVSSADAALIAKVPEMVELLRELEWGGPGNGGMPYCVLCGCLDHAPDCRLHAILKLAEEPE